MGFYRKRPVVVQAVQFTGDNFEEVRGFTGVRPAPWSDRVYIENFNPIGTYSLNDDDEVTAEVYDKLHSTWVGVKDGQWIIRGVDGEFYPCDPDVFERTYEEVRAA